MLRAIIFFLILSVSCFAGSPKEVYKSFDFDSFSKFYYTIEISGEDLIYIAKQIENKHDNGRKDKEMISKGKIKNDKVIFTVQYCNGRKQEINVEYSFKKDDKACYINGEKHLKSE